jgi:hypothetical protein
MIQHLTLRLDTTGRDVVHLPGETDIENALGHFSVTTSKKEGWVTIETELTIETAIIPPDAWGALRALLLEAADPVHRTVLLE